MPRTPHRRLAGPTWPLPQRYIALLLHSIIKTLVPVVVRAMGTLSVARTAPSIPDRLSGTCFRTILHDELGGGGARMTAFLAGWPGGIYGGAGAGYSGR